MAGASTNFWTNLFSWDRGKSDNDDNEKTRIVRTTRAITDFTDKFAVNPALTNGIYNNTYRGMKLAGFGFNIINVPVSFMGLPIVDAENEIAKEYLNNLIIEKTRDCRSTHMQSHRDGTVWGYPKFSAERGLEWDMIPDQNVKKIVRNINTGDIVQVTTEEEITFNSLLTDNEISVNKKIVYTVDKIITTYEGDLPAGLKNTTTINPAGIVPVPFANNKDINMSRGHSDYERILSDLKSYHDVDLAEIQTLAKFSTKMIQTVKDYDAWVKNNFKGDESLVAEMQIGLIDYIVNLEDEKTEFIHASQAIEGFEMKLKTIFHKLVELSGIPEIAWGLKTEGNLASVEENMEMLMRYCRDKQEQKVEPYGILISATARLLSAASVIPESGKIVISWDVLDSTSETTKAEIFKNFATAIKELISVAGLSEDQLYKLWKMNFPSLTTEDYKTWRKGLDNMTAHVVKTKSTATDLLDLQGLGDEES